MKFSHFTILVLFILAGCEGTKETSNPVLLDFLYPFRFNLSKVSIDSNTPMGIGTLVSSEEIDNGLVRKSFCNWFLISKNQAMTSSYCIPKSLKETKGQDCSESLQGKIQTHSGPREAKCRKLLFASKVSESEMFSNDYALIELDRDIDDSEYYPVSRKGIKDGEKVKVLGLYHSPTPNNDVESHFKPYACIIKSSDIFGTLPSAGSSPAFIFREENSYDECEATDGNSGAPVVSEDGSLIGVINRVRKQGETLAKKVETIKSIPAPTIFTNLACQKFNVPSIDKNISKDCIEEVFADRIKPNDEKARIDYWIKKKVSDQRKNLPSYIEFEDSVAKYKDTIEISFHPLCIKPLREWSERDLSNISSDEVYGNYKKTTSPKETFSGVSVSVSDYGNYQMNSFGWSTESQYMLFFDLQKLEDAQGSYYEIIEPNVLSVYRPQKHWLNICRSKG